MKSKELIEGALKRVNALLGKNGKLYRDNTGYYVIGLLDESSRSADEMIAYLHGIEDTALLFSRNNISFHNNK